jgi:hypothetical protein
MGCGKERRRDSRRHKLGCILVRLRMRRVAAGVRGVYRILLGQIVSKLVLIGINLCINIYFFNFNSNIGYILSIVNG